jgi:hypothetical protein
MDCPYDADRKARHIACSLLMAFWAVGNEPLPVVSFGAGG